MDIRRDLAFSSDGRDRHEAGHSWVGISCATDPVHDYRLHVNETRPVRGEPWEVREVLTVTGWVDEAKARTMKDEWPGIPITHATAVAIMSSRSEREVTQEAELEALKGQLAVVEKQRDDWRLLAETSRMMVDQLRAPSVVPSPMVMSPRLTQEQVAALYEFPSQLMGKLDAWMTGNGRSQKDVADELNVSQPTVNRWLNGSMQPSKSSVVLLADLLGLPVAEAWELHHKQAEPSEPRGES